MMTLRCPLEPGKVHMGRNHAGYIILAEPTGEETTINSLNGQRMLVRPADFYENIFKKLCLDVVYREDYPSYMADGTYEINAERVWLL